MATKLRLKIDNMMCDECAARVAGALDVAGVTDLKVRQGSATLCYDGSAVSEEQLVRAVVDAGFPCRVKKGLFRCPVP